MRVRAISRWRPRPLRMVTMPLCEMLCDESVTRNATVKQNAGLSILAEHVAQACVGIIRQRAQQGE